MSRHAAPKTNVESMYLEEQWTHKSRHAGNLRVVEITADGRKTTMQMRMRDLVRRINAAIEGELCDRVVEDEREQHWPPPVSSGAKTVTHLKKPASQPNLVLASARSPKNNGGEVSPTGSTATSRNAAPQASHHRHRNLHARDLRSMDPSFSQKAQHPAVVVRRHVILANFDPLRVVVVHDRMLVLLPPAFTSVEHSFVTDLEAQLRLVGVYAVKDDPQSEEEEESSTVVPVVNLDVLSEGDDLEAPPPKEGHPAVATKKAVLFSSHEETHPMSDSEGDDFLADDEMSSSSSKNKRRGSDPFELRALEAVLAVATRRLAAASDELAPLARVASDGLKSTRMSLEHLERLRTLKNRVSFLEARARDTAEALSAVLDEDEDMCMMRLSKLRAEPHLFELPLSAAMLTQHEDVELLLENYLQHTTAVQTALELVRLSIENAESSFTMKLDISRNRLIAVDTIFALFAMVFGLAAVVGGFWGMNLDQHKTSFTVVTVATASVCVLVASVTFFFLFRSNILFF
mmetsp:Transcript_16002/g.48419  ORF Transcript_16002/g.48419 Transcript_16002/m.48419 type:complete len:518 (-) Transcript_16002:293-1846(-)